MMDNLFYAFGVVLFAAVILLAEGACLWWSNTHGSGPQRVRRRLSLMSGGVSASARVSILKQRRYARGDGLDALLHLLPFASSVDRALIQSGVHWLLARFAGLTLLALALGVVLLLVWPVPLLPACMLVLMCGSAPYLMVERARRRRLRTIEEQLPDMADFIARALRSGHSFSNVLQMAGTELPEPLAGEFRLAHEEVNYGVPMNEALHSLAARVPLPDLRYLVIAVLIQRESGGNLAEILANISHIIRQRLKLQAQVRVLSAEGRMSAWILGLLPFVVVAIMSLTSPHYISQLWTDPGGRHVLTYAVGMMTFGVLWLRSLIRIRV